MIDLLMANPSRAPDAWWRRARGYYFEGQLIPTVKRDGGRGNFWIRKAIRFLDAARQAKTKRQRMSVMAAYPAIYWAYDLRTRADKRVALAAVEARILARQTDPEIAKAHGCWPRYIEAYEALFFNVRDRLKHQDFILCSVLRDVHNEGLENCKADVLWKLFAYLGGPHVLEALMGRMPVDKWAARPECVATVFQEIAIDGIKQNGAVAALRVPVEAESCLQLLDVFTRVVEIERTTELTVKESDAMHETVRSMLGELEHLTVSSS